jgi:hypothetical protein
MIGKERLVKERELSFNLVIEFKKKLADHIVKAHRGVPAPACHTCLSLREGIQGNEQLMKDIDEGTIK